MSLSQTHKIQIMVPKGEKYALGAECLATPFFKKYTIETIITKDYHPLSKESK
jgi:hypothetical protein